MAIKKTVELYPDADAVYGCDAPWWQYVKGLPDFRGRKFCWSGNGLVDYPDIERIDIVQLGRNRYSEDLQFEPGIVGAGGGNSGFQAFNLVAQWNPGLIVLIGFDMNEKDNLHWYGLNRWNGAGNPNAKVFKDWMKALAKAAPVLKQRGIQVVNANPASAIQCFPFMSIEDAFEDWKQRTQAVSVDRL